MRNARTLVFVLGLLLCVPAISLAQSTNATLMGRVLDPSKAAVPGASIEVTNVDTNVTYKGTADNEGRFAIPGLPPGNYRVSVAKPGFKSIVKPDVVLHVQDVIALNFDLQLGSVSEVVTVSAGAPLINTESATVSTVVDRQFAENLPLNGRSFQSLIELTPGVVVIPSNGFANGQFSVNGQRGESNYWMVDGVSANIGMSSGLAGNTFGGAIGSFSALGGTNSLVSVDALEEFRIQTSTYAPEFGRTPGGQISILTRSGTDQWHGTLFDYLRNDALDANDWFANNKGLPKPRERQNDLGGTLSGPVLKGKTFFFFSYEGLRLRLPQTALTTVPDLNARKNAMPAIQPDLNAFPLPNGPEDPANPGAAQLNASYSNPATLDAYSLRVDHRLNNKLSLFARYNYSPSEIDPRGAGSSLSTISSSRITTQTATVGNTWSLSAAITNDFRFNYSRTSASSRSDLDNFGGAVPLSSLGLPSPFTSQNASLGLSILSLTSTGSSFGSGFSVGRGTQNRQSQINAIDNLSLLKGSHSLKFGFDFRRLAPVNDPFIYNQQVFFSDVPSAESLTLLGANITSTRRAALLLKNLGAFGQDTWRIKPRLTITYGVRWDVDFAPTTNGGANILAVTGYSLPDLSSLALAPLGTSPFETRYGNIAPRGGIAYQVSQSQEWQTVLRGGFGVFYDLVTSQAGNTFNPAEYPFGATNTVFGPPLGGTSTFPLSPGDAAPPPIVPPNASNGQVLFAYDPHLKMPYTLEWNVALEQALGKQQTLSASYIGSVGRRLLLAGDFFSPNASFGQALLFGNTGTSDYDALQLQFNRRLSHGLQALASYTWSHSIDDGSAGSSQLSPTLDSHANRGPSDFDIRNAFSAAVTYDVPALKMNAFAGSILHGWSVQNTIQARSAIPVDIVDISLTQLNRSVGGGTIRPDLTGQPLYLFGPQCAAVFSPLGLPCAGGKGFNPSAFTDPPSAACAAGVCAVRQGNIPRNFLRGFGETQWDFAVHRDFPIRESLKLQFRAEMFNVLNHPNFGPPNANFLSPQNGGPLFGFGVSTKMLGQYLNGGTSGIGNIGGGALSPLYQIGGPRSIQFALKVAF